MNNSKLNVLVYICLCLFFLKTFLQQKIRVQRYEGPDTFTGLECNQSRCFYEDKDNVGCKCFDTQPTFSSYGKHQIGCYDKSIRKNPDIKHEFITVNNVTTQIKTNLCLLQKVKTLFIWDLIDNVGRWDEYKLIEDVVKTNKIYITIGERKNWDGLLVHFLYSCKTNISTDITYHNTGSCLVKFTGDIMYPLQNIKVPLPLFNPRTKPTKTTTTPPPTTTTTATKTTKTATLKVYTKVTVTKSARPSLQPTLKKFIKPTTAREQRVTNKQNLGVILTLVIERLTLISLVFCFIWRIRKRNQRLEKNYQSLKIKYEAGETYTALVSMEQNMLDNYAVPSLIRNEVMERELKIETKAQYEVPNNPSQDGNDNLHVDQEYEYLGMQNTNTNIETDS
ncbi:uncharacterized protein LOC130622329 isoform X1 [Hydractinia symbiolongicarpus]|uniref:uncharacterized protein LOC130622329 isoform X1 n=1 Tax=Hydractinia symbiolongicarpus TaxID=13093 RepID=UPI00254E21A9|nr:uncharacterized protein LOC130622329 isoform X1 [Hydractinia symbiolongicarpus]